MQRTKQRICIIGLIFTVLLIGCKDSSSDPVTPSPENPPEPPTEKVLAFPGAEGFGRYTTGGRGGVVIYVTNLKDSGPGSLRNAIQTPGARYVLFKVSGTIALKSPLNISNGNLTIAGQTAPGDGICIKNYSVTIDANNVIIRFIRFRMGDEAAYQGDALGARFHKNIIIDHCSVSWGTDESLTFYANENTTVQWCIISESLRNSVHEKGTHGYGGIWGGKKASFHHNLLAHHDSRNPRLGERADKAFALTDLVDLRNNVIYNWHGNSTYGGEAMNVNIVNNYYKPGPATPDSKDNRIISIDKDLNEDSEVYNIWGKFYIKGNYVVGSPNTTNDNWTYGVFNQFHSKYGEISEQAKSEMRLEQPLEIKDNVNTDPAEVAYQKELEVAGASLFRDAVDKRIIKEVRTGTYTYEGSNGSTNGLIDSQADVGGWPELESKSAPGDTDEDGMPDDWEMNNDLNPNQANANGRNLSTGYDNIEVYINNLVKEITEMQKTINKSNHI